MSDAKKSVLRGIRKWLAVSPFGTPIKFPSGKQIVAFKTPRVDIHFVDQHLSQADVSAHYKKEHNLHLRYIIDLTNTDRYYEFKSEGEQKSEFIKMRCVGQELPTEEFITEFMAKMSECEKEMEDEDIIGIHCTHGVNRTGFLIVYYLCKKYDMSLKDALTLFDDNRKPHMLEDEKLIDNLAENFGSSEKESQDWLTERKLRAKAYEEEFSR